MELQENGLALAYIGDAVYELKIREHLLGKGMYKVNDLHNAATKYTCATAQKEIIDSIMSELNEEEIEYYKRGRNSGGTHKPKNASLSTYRVATGFESLIGYLYLIKNLKRLDEIIEKSINFINNK